MLHSGSRNVGNTTASFYDSIAGDRPGSGQNWPRTVRQCHSCVLSSLTLRGRRLRGQHGSLNYLEIDSAEGQDYLKDMQWCCLVAQLLGYLFFMSPNTVFNSTNI